MKILGLASLGKILGLGSLEKILGIASLEDLKGLWAYKLRENSRACKLGGYEVLARKKDC